MRAWTAVLTIGLSLVLVTRDWDVDTPLFAIGAFGLFAGLVLLSSARGGLAALAIPLVLATMATVRGEPAYALLVGWYGLGVVLAAVAARQERRAAYERHLEMERDRHASRRPGGTTQARGQVPPRPPGR